jgi:hypothetical protein
MLRKDLQLGFSLILICTWGLGLRQSSDTRMAENGQSSGLTALSSEGWELLRHRWIKVCRLNLG